MAGIWKIVVVGLLLCIGTTLVGAESFGVKKTVKRPEQYGNVTINNFSTQAGAAPVVFKHWLHRSQYTCRLCHVDLGFAMTAGGTRITEADIRSGLYCGACHNGTVAFAGEVDSQGRTKNCERCHSFGKEVAFKKEFGLVTKKFPRARFGNRVDWIKAEEQGLITLKDEIPGISIRRKTIKSPVDATLHAKKTGMPDIIFSHEKHAVWNGCELCHPDLFGVKKGATVYSMQDIFNGKYCGACHDKVAFVNMDCQLCHTKDI